MASKNQNVVNWLGRKYTLNEEGDVIDELNTKIGGKMADTIREQLSMQQAEAQETKANKKLPKPPEVEDAVDAEKVSDTSGGDEPKTPKKRGIFGRAARKFGRNLFAAMFPKLSVFLQELKDEEDENRKTSQNLDTNMQYVSEQLNETNNLLMQLNLEMTKMLGLLGQIISKGGVGSQGGGLGKSLVGGLLGGILGVGAAEAIPYALKWLSGDTKEKPIPVSENLTPAPPAPEENISANDSITPEIVLPIQTADATKVNPSIQTVSDTGSNLSERTMAATREFEAGSANMISAYNNMTSEQQAKAGDLGENLNTYKTSVAQKYGVKDFAVRSADYVAQEGELTPKFQIKSDNDANVINPELKKLGKREDTAGDKNVDINADRITFNADGMLFKQTGVTESDNQGYGGNKTLPGSSTGGNNGGGGLGNFMPPPPELATVKSKTGASAKVAAQYKDRFQGLVDYLDQYNPGYIKALGGYEARMNVNDGTKVSAHAYGAALDINPSENPNGSTKTTLPSTIGMVARSFGLGWGMLWNSNKDPMHFSAMPREGGSGDMFIPSGSSMSPPAEAPSTSSGSFVMSAPTKGSTLSTVSSSSMSVSAPSSAPVPTIVSATSSPPDPNYQAAIPAKLKNPNIAGNVEPDDAHILYKELFGPAINLSYSNHDEVR